MGASRSFGTGSAGMCAISRDLSHLNRAVNLRLGLDLRIQYLAYRELKEAVERHQASSGSIVMLDARSGEVLAMASQPSFNPNNREGLQPRNYRNRAALDLLEPGSTIKPLVVAAALESGEWSLDSRVDTGRGYVRVGPKIIEDRTALGVIDFPTLLRRSSQVGAVKVAMSMEPRRLWEMLTAVGFGGATESGFPGEAESSLSNYEYWLPVEHATMSYGYGMAATPLQLARAYTVFASGGRVMPVSLVRRETAPQGVQVLSPDTAFAVASLLEEPLGQGGTATRARDSRLSGGGQDRHGRKIRYRRLRAGPPYGSFRGLRAGLQSPHCGRGRCRRPHNARIFRRPGGSPGFLTGRRPERYACWALPWMVPKNQAALWWL